MSCSAFDFLDSGIEKACSLVVMLSCAGCWKQTTAGQLILADWLFATNLDNKLIKSNQFFPSVER